MHANLLIWQSHAINLQKAVCFFGNHAVKRGINGKKNLPEVQLRRAIQGKFRSA